MCTAAPIAVSMGMGGTNGIGSSVSVIDTTSNTVTKTLGIADGVGNAAQGVAISPDGAHLYVTNGSDNTVSVISIA